ncbi:hypothetical protein [Coleofasciculus sp. FACHB-129]|nr:hypothetical protein [Coleofasciculus sp. FACHB-129]
MSIGVAQELESQAIPAMEAVIRGFMSIGAAQEEIYEFLRG